MSITSGALYVPSFADNTTDYTTWITAIANKLVATGWTVEEVVVTNATDVTARISTAGTGEVCISASTTRDMNVANVYGGSSYGFKELMVAFSPDASFGAITAGNNPYDDATFCSDAGAFKFCYVRASSLGALFSSGNYAIQMAAEDSGTWGYLICREPWQSYAGRRNSIFWGDSAYQSLVGAPGDTNAQVQIMIPFTQLLFSENINDLTTGATDTGLQVQFQDDVGTIFDTGLLSYDDTNHDKTFEDIEGNMAGRVITVTRAIGGGWTQGDKGVLDPKFMACCRMDAEINLITDSGDLWHVRNGLCVMYDSGSNMPQ